MSLNAINVGARVAQKAFYAGASHGMYGYIFADLINHTFVIERERGNRVTQTGAESTTRRITDIQTKRENGKAIEMVTKEEIYSPLMLAKDSPLPPEIATNRRRLRKVHPLLTCVRALWEYQRNGNGVFPVTPEQLALFATVVNNKHLELQLDVETLKGGFGTNFLRNLGHELAPVTAFLGGQLAQDVINVLGNREQPIQNLMLFDGEESAGPIYALHPIFPATGNSNSLPILAGVPPVNDPVMVV